MAPAGNDAKEYQKLVRPYADSLRSQYSFVAEWFQEDLPLEDEDGIAFDGAVQGLLRQVEASECRKFRDFFQSNKRAADTSMPVLSPDGPPALRKERVLVFADRAGLCEKVLGATPPLRTAEQKFVKGPWTGFDGQRVKELFGGEAWDVVIFGVGCDVPETNCIREIMEFDRVVAKLYFHILQVIQGNGKCDRLVCLTRGAFSEDANTHAGAGLGAVSAGMLFGMSNTARLELENTRLQYIDTEYTVESPYWSYSEPELAARLASEVFRRQTVGHNTVRILNSGRYVLRQMSAKEYEHPGASFLVPRRGIVGVSGGNGALGLVMTNWLLDKAEEQGARGLTIKLLSRSMKISGQNSRTWEAIQKRARSLGVVVEQDKCDVGSQSSVDHFIESCSPNLVGFIHSAGVLQDAMLFNMKWDQFETVSESKHRAALKLHDALERFTNPDLSFFWMFSSIAVYGSVGQTNYSGSNSFLDNLARHRRALGKPAFAIQWGAWGEVGMAATLDAASKRRMEQSFMPPFTNSEGLVGLESGLRTTLPYVSVFKLNASNLVATMASADSATQHYVRNFTSEMLPPPPLKPAWANTYALFRMLRFPYAHSSPSRLIMESLTLKRRPSRDADDDDAVELWRP